MKTFIIGDIHGCSRTLSALLDRIRPDSDTDRLILLGDLFDRGPGSWEVFQTVKMLASAFGGRFVLLRGNHEDYLLQPKLTLMERLAWNRVGRLATVDSFKRHGERMEDSVPWLKENCRLFYREEAFQCVHAGLLMDPIEVNDLQTLIHDHSAALRNSYTGPLTVTGHIALSEPTYFAGDQKTAVQLTDGTWRQLPACGIICIDTGCGKGGRLTAMTIENGQYLLESVR